MLSIGLLSTATIAREHLIPAFQSASNANLTAVASRELSKAKKLARQLDVSTTFGSYEELLESDEVDAVYIPLPTSQHIDWCLKAAAAGKHVLCEKPIALKAGEIKKLQRAASKHGVLISEAFMVTYHPQWRKVRDLIASGKIGNLRQVQGSFTYFNKDPDNMRNIPKLGGGVLPDIGVYPTVATRFATGQEPLRVQSRVDFDPKFKTDCYASVRAEFKDFELSFYISTQMSNRQTMVFHGDKGFIELSAPFNSNLYEGDEVKLHNAGHSETRTYRFTGVNQYRLQVEAFANAVAGKKSDVFTLEDSLLNQKVIDAIYKASNPKATNSARWQKV